MDQPTSSKRVKVSEEDFVDGDGSNQNGLHLMEDDNQNDNDNDNEGDDDDDIEDDDDDDGDIEDDYDDDNEDGVGNDGAGNDDTGNDDTGNDDTDNDDTGNQNGLHLMEDDNENDNDNDNEGDDDDYIVDGNGDDIEDDDDDADNSDDNEDGVSNDDTGNDDDSNNDDEHNAGDGNVQIGNEGIEQPANEEVDDNEEDALITDEEVEFEVEAPGALFQGFRQNLGMNVPLRNNDQLKAIDHLLSILARSVRFHRSYENIIEDLKWAKVSFQHINIPTDKEALWKVLGRDKSNLISRLYCSLCKEKVAKGLKVTRRCNCGGCGPERDDSNVGTFIQVLVTPQLRDLLSMPNIAESLRFKFTRVKQNHEAMEDIYDGNEYKKLSEPGNFLANSNNFSLTLWADGISISKSSKATVYPIILEVNELAPHARKKNFLLAGVYVGKDSPFLSELLHPIIRELNKLHETGITWTPDGVEEVQSKFITTIFTADSVARPNALRMMQFNGFNGCTFCTAPGVRGENRTVYPAQPFPPRTDASIRDDAMLAFQTETTVNGVKGITSLASLSGFDLVSGVVVDSCHNAFLGVARQLLSMNLQDVGEPWYVGNPENRTTIDNRLSAIKPPTRISRSPRSISMHKMWKASEWRNWLLYYALPCLDGILPRQYLQHWAKLAEAIFIFNNASITENEINAGEALLQNFVEEFEQYGLQNMSFNVHLLTHVPQTVRNWGPLWVYTTFPFESSNRDIVAAITSPYHKADQIITRFMISKFILAASNTVNIAPITRDTIQRLLKRSKFQVPQGMVEGHNFKGQGKLITRQPRETEIDLIRTAGFLINRETMLNAFRKAVVHGNEYQIKDRVTRKFCNSMVYCRTGIWIITGILSFENGDDTIHGIIGKRLRTRGVAHGVSYMRIIEPSNETAFIPYENIVGPGFRMSSPEYDCAVPLANSWETD